MKSIIRYTIILAVVGVLLFFGGQRAQRWFAERNKPRYRLSRLETGSIYRTPLAQLRLRSWRTAL